MIRILVGHVLDKLRELPDESVHCCITSPPYYGLRSYGTEPQVWGCTSSPDEGRPPGNRKVAVSGGINSCEHEWGAEKIAKRQPFSDGFVPDHGGAASRSFKHEGGTVSQGSFCHCGAWRGDLGLEPTVEMFIAHLVEVFHEVRRALRKDGSLWLNIGDSYADKQLQMIPAALALALRADGWWLRSEIVWAKRAPMPESCTDRPTCAHEKVFLLSRSARYFYDAIAVQEDAESDHPSGNGYDRAEQLSRGGRGQRQQWDNVGGKRNMRNVWHLGPEPFPEAHFATFVSEIPRRAILAGTSAKGVCPKCGAPWVRVVEKTFRENGRGVAGGQKGFDGQNGWAGYPGGVNDVETIGWRPSCPCDAFGDVGFIRTGKPPDPIPATVLDPFLGSGTTALVADQLGRDCIGIELSPGYAAMAERRLRDDAGMFADLRHLDTSEAAE